MAKIVKGWTDMAGKYRCYVVDDKGNETMLKFDKEPDEMVILAAYDKATIIPEKTIAELEAEKARIEAEIAAKTEEKEAIETQITAKSK
jgi:hypothetical protein